MIEEFLYQVTSHLIQVCMPVENWFPTPVYYATVDNFKLIQTEISTALDILTQENAFAKAEGWGSSTHSVSDPTFADNVIDRLNLTTFKDEIYLHIVEYMKGLNSTCALKFRIASSWFTNTQPGQYTRIHCHGHSDISGVYYFKTNTKDGSLTFVSPTSSLASTVFAKLRDTVSYPPAEGKIILFPGWLNHTVNENETADTRISVSFNVYFEK